jgi:hypothetical protein
MPIDNILRSALKNGKSAVKNGVRNGVKNGINGNGFKNGVQEITGGELAKRQYVEQQLARQNFGTRKPGSAVRAQRPTSRMGARSIIASEPVKMLKAYPNRKEEINMWMRNAYKHARENGSLDGYPEYVGPDGKTWRPKPSQSAFEGLKLKGDDKQARAKILKKRSDREKPWTKSKGQDEIYAALLKVGKEHLYDKLIRLMKKDYTRKKKSLKGLTKGHFISLDNGGLDVAENFGPQRGKSLKIRKGNRFEVDPGNYSEQADSTVGFGSGKGVDNWDDYVAMKLSELE